MPDCKTDLKTYSSPTLKRLTPEQAKLILLGHASQGDEGARELLSVLFPDPNEHDRVSPNIEGKREGGFTTKHPRASLLFLRRLTSEFKDNAIRLIRG